MCFIYSSASLFSHTPITSLFPVFPFYRTTPFPLLLPFSVLPLCFQSTPTAAPICLLFCVHLLFYPVWIALLILSGLGSNLPSLNSTCPSYHLSSSFFFFFLLRLGWSCLISREAGRGRVAWAGLGMVPPCMPGTQLWRTELSSSLRPSFSAHLVRRGDWAMLCCVVLSLARHGCRILAGPLCSRFGFEMQIGPLLCPHGWARLLWL